MAKRRTDLRLGSLDIERIFENANVNSTTGKIDLGAIASGTQGSQTSISVGAIEGVNSIRMAVDGILLAQLSGSNPFSAPTLNENFFLNAHLIPGLDEEYDLGSSSLKWRDLYLSGDTIYLGNTRLQTNGSAITFVNNLNQTKTIANTEDIPTNQTFIDTALTSSTFVTTVRGQQGPPGVQGPVGAQGNTGLTGPQGIQGPSGADGATGPTGPTGPQGPTGATGPQGIQGPQGPAGTGITFQGSVATINDLPSTASQGDAYIVQSDDSLHVHDGSSFVSGGSIQGPQGQQGIQGPIGQDGATGPQGPAGNDGAQGPTGQQGPQGPGGASVTTLALSNNTLAAALSDGTNITGNVSIDLNSLSDVDITNTAHTLSDGYVLTYNSTHNHWHPEPVSSTASNISLDDISDVVVPTPTAGSGLVYNNSEWVEDKITHLPDATGTYTNTATWNYSNHQIEYHSRLNVTASVSNYYSFLLPDPSQAILGRIFEINFNTTAGYNSTRIYTNRSNTVRPFLPDFVDDGNLLSPIYYTIPGYYNVKFKVIYNGTKYLWENIHRAPISQPEHSEIGLLDTSVSTTDTGTDGNINFKTNNVSRWDINSSGHIIPATNATYDLGEASNKVRHLYLSDNSIKFDSGDLGVNTNGNLSFTPTGEAPIEFATLNDLSSSNFIVAAATTSHLPNIQNGSNLGNVSAAYYLSVSGLTLTVDGYQLSVGDRLLVKNGTNTPGSSVVFQNNGIYELESENPCLLRRIYGGYNQVTPKHDAHYIANGTSNGNKIFITTKTTVYGAIYQYGYVAEYVEIGEAFLSQENNFLSQENNLLTIQGDSTSAAIKLNCENNSHGVTLQGPPHSANATYTLTLPETIGFADQVMKVDGSGNLGWVTPSSGGSSVESMIAVNTTTLNLTNWNPQFAFSNIRGATYSTRNTWFDANNTILTKTIQNTTTEKAYSTYPSTSFPAGKYKFIWQLTLVKPSSGTWSSNAEITNGLLNHAYGPGGQINSNHSLMYKRLLHFSESPGNIINVAVEFIFEMLNPSILRLWADDNPTMTYNYWLDQQFTLLDEYQEMQKLSNYNFDSSLTL